jgi:hypothetical protein
MLLLPSLTNAMHQCQVIVCDEMVESLASTPTLPTFPSSVVAKLLKKTIARQYVSTNKELSTEAKARDRKVSM